MHPKVYNFEECLVYSKPDESDVIKYRDMIRENAVKHSLQEVNSIVGYTDNCHYGESKLKTIWESTNSDHEVRNNKDTNFMDDLKLKIFLTLILKKNNTIEDREIVDIVEWLQTIKHAFCFICNWRGPSQLFLA